MKKAVIYIHGKGEMQEKQHTIFLFLSIVM